MDLERMAFYSIKIYKMLKKNEFQVVVMHGHSEAYLEIKEIILECKFTPRVMIEEYSADIILENLRNLIWEEAHCVIIVMTKDDEMVNGSKRARQNVVFELGYCFGVFDSLPDKSPYKSKDALLLVAEEGVELFADIDGLTRIDYETGKLQDRKHFITGALKKSYSKAKKYY